MGLTIHGKGSKKSYNWSYGALHGIRWIALRECGWPKEIGDKTGRIDTNFYVVPSGLSADCLNNMLGAMALCGYRFPNIMLHSDCDGKYTKGGEVDTARYLDGSSIGLNSELRDLWGMAKDNPEYEGWLPALKDMKEVVAAIMDKGDGKVIFG